MRRCKIDLEDEHCDFRLVKALLWSKSPMSSICYIMILRLVAPDGFQAAIFIVWRTAL
jgi:hypothetical protein